MRYATARKAANKGDYWDRATLLEFAVLGRDETDTDNQLCEALAVARAWWEVESTARNLRLIREARSARGEHAGWIEALEEQLLQASRRLSGGQAGMMRRRGDRSVALAASS